MGLTKFQISAVEVEAKDATVAFTTDAIRITNNSAWSVQFIKTSVDGSPTYTVQVTNDKDVSGSWVAYSAGATALSTDTPYADSSIAYKYMRVVYVATTVTTGTQDLLLNQLDRA